MYDIITIGSSTRDVFIKSEHFKVIKDKDFVTGQAECFALGTKIEIKDIVFTTGGGGANTAVTFSRQGLNTACIGVIGEDVGGEELLRKLKKEKVDIQYFQKHEDGTTAYSVILVNPNGERTILSYKGEGQHFDVNKIPFEKLETKWLFLDSLGGHFDFLEKAISWAKEKGIKVATNPGGKELAHGLEKLEPQLRDLDVVIMNQEEASRLFSVDFEKEKEIFKKFDEAISGIVVMTRGPDGVMVSDNKNKYIAGIPDSPVIERTGAGDAWSSGFVAEYVRSKDISKAIQFATANASSVVTKVGATEGILKKDDWGKWPLVEVEVEKL